MTGAGSATEADVQLNRAQTEAVRHRGGPLLVSAGAGTGKTRVVVHRLAYFIASGTDARRLLAITFTNRAAAEVKRRVVDLIGPEGSRINVGTFHWFGHRLLRRYGSRSSLGSDFTLLSPRDSLSVLRSLNFSDLLPATQPVTRLRDRISLFRNGRQAADGEQMVTAEIVSRYTQELRRRHALDLDDLVLESVALLGNDERIRQRLETFFTHVLVDEYQDTNPPQVELLKRLVGRGGQITAVGDEDQAIYGWRYASGRNMAAFVDDFPGATIIRLERNYRSTQRILNAGNELLRHNSGRLGKNLISARRPGKKPVVSAGADEADEASYVAATVENLVRRGVAPNEIAILFRTNAQSRAIEEALVRGGIRYEVRAGLRFYERAEIRRIVDGLSVLATPSSVDAWGRLLRHIRGLGPVRADALATTIVSGSPSGAPSGWMAGALRVCDELQSITVGADLGFLVAHVSGVLERATGEIVAGSDELESAADNVSEFRAMAEQFSRESRDPDLLSAFLDRLHIGSEPQDSAGVHRDDAVQLMTLHAAKGLEFEAVLVVGLEEGLLPHRRSLGSVESVEEERRLLYVGMTRARDHLYLTYAGARLFGAAQGASGQSRFLSDMPINLVELNESPAPSRKQRLTRVEVGERVRHQRWGPGAVSAVDGQGRNALATIQFDSGDTKTVQLRYAPLVRLS